MKPKIIDNFIPNHYNKGINDLIFRDASKFPWYYLPNISGWENKFNVEDVKFVNNQSGFYHLLYSQGSQASPMFQALLPFLGYVEDKFDVSINNLIRVRVGMNIHTGEEGSHYPHTDLDIPNKTLLYYLDESDGNTIFYEQKKDKLEVSLTNPHTQNQAVLFDGLTLHSSSSPVEYSKRTTININFN